MALLKKVLLGVAGVVSLGLVGNSFASVTTFDNTSTDVTPANLVATGSNFVEVIKAAKGSAYANLKFVSVGNYLGSFTRDDKTGEVTQITITSLPTDITGVPDYPFDYTPTLTMSATISNKCTTITNELYSISAGSGIVNISFQDDLKKMGNNLFSYLLANSGLKAYCN